MVNVLKPTELYTLTARILWYVRDISIKKRKKKFLLKENVVLSP